MSLWLLLAAHLIADFSLQSADWAEKKTQKFRYLAGHGVVYAAVIAVVAFVCISVDAVWIPFAVIAVSHFLIDWIRVATDKKFKTSKAHLISFVIDQVLHIAVICFCVDWFGLNAQNRSWLVALGAAAPVEQILRYALIFVIILEPASVFVKKLSNYVSESPNKGGRKEEPPVGSIIGKLERILTVILVLCNEIGAIGFVLTAKSIARYKQLDNQIFAEKYLVGTLSSTSIAIITALLLK